MAERDPELRFSQRLPVTVHRATPLAIARRWVVSHPAPFASMAGVLVLALVVRSTSVLGLLMFPMVALVKATTRQTKLERAQGVTPLRVDTARIPSVALVQAGDGGLSVEGMNISISRASLLRAAVDETGTRVFIETKRDLPNFTFTIEDELEVRTLLAALGLIERPASAVARLPDLLVRGNLGTATWVDTLRAQDRIDYRSAPVGPDELWRVLEDNGAAHEARAAAAIALFPVLDPSDKAARARWRRVKSDAPYRLRVAMKAARGADAAAMIRTLDACSRED